MDLSNFGIELKKKNIEIKDENLNSNIDKIKENFKKDEIKLFLPWFLKYQPNSFEDLIFTKEISKINEFFKNFKKGKALFLYGRAGSGKTTTISFLAKHYDLELFELNASDSRNKNAIEESVGKVIKQKSLFNKKKVILIDEADGLAGREDRGGAAVLAKLVKESVYPIIFTANDGESNKVKALKKVSIIINFENHTKELLIGIGKKILNLENISYNEKDLEEFANIRSSIDIRAFINDLQSSVYDGKFQLDDNLEIRDYKREIQSLLDKIYFSYPEDSYKSSFNTNINLDDLFLILEENTALRYDKTALINAFNEISKADIYRGRIMKWQYWRFLVYVNFYLTYAVSSAKISPKNAPYKENSRILKIWIYNNMGTSFKSRTKNQKENNEQETFIEKYANKIHRSTKKSRSEDLNYIKFIYTNNEEFRNNFIKEFNLDEKTQKALTTETFEK